MFAKATKWLCSVTHHQTGHVVKEKTVSFPFVSDFFETWSSLHCFVNFFVSEAEASNEAKNTGRDNTKSKEGNNMSFLRPIPTPIFDTNMLTIP